MTVSWNECCVTGVVHDRRMLLSVRLSASRRAVHMSDVLLSLFVTF